MISAPTENERTVTGMAEYVAKEQIIDWFSPYGHLDKPIPCAGRGWMEVLTDGC